MRARRLLRKVLKKRSPSFPPDEQRAPLSKSARARIARLPQLYQVVVALRVARHMSYDEIASTLGRNVNTVKSQGRRGKARLQYLEEAEESQGSFEGSATVTVSLQEIQRIKNIGVREAVKLHYIQQLSYREIAKKLGRSVGTVKGWIHRGMREIHPNPKAMRQSGKRRAAPRKRSNWSDYEIEYIRCALPDQKLRSIMTMYYVQGDTLAQIAAKLGISSEACIKAKIKRGRQFVKEYAKD